MITKKPTLEKLSPSFGSSLLLKQHTEKVDKNNSSNNHADGRQRGIDHIVAQVVGIPYPRHQRGGVPRGGGKPG